MLSLVVDDSPARKKEMVPKKMTWKNVIYVGGYSSELSLFPSSTVSNRYETGKLHKILFIGDELAS